MRRGNANYTIDSTNCHLFTCADSKHGYCRIAVKDGQMQAPVPDMYMQQLDSGVAIVVDLLMHSCMSCCCKLRLAPHAPSSGWHAFLFIIIIVYCCCYHYYYAAAAIPARTRWAAVMDEVEIKMNFRKMAITKLFSALMPFKAVNTPCNTTFQHTAMPTWIGQVKVHGTSSCMYNTASTSSGNPLRQCKHTLACNTASTSFCSPMNTW